MTTNTEPAKHSTSRLSMVMLRDAMLAGVVAAIVTTTIAALGTTADVSLAVDSKRIPLGAFPFWTVTGTLLSIIPAVALPDDSATRAVLLLAHLAAAAIIIPAIDRNLDHSTPA